MKRAWIARGIIIICAAMAGATASTARAEDWTKTYQISGKANLHVSTGDGDVVITSADQKQIDAKVTTVGYKIGPGDVQIVESQSGDNVSLEIKIPHSHSWWGFHGHTSIHVELRVPREIDTDISTGDGNVTAQNLAGNLRFRTGDGNIDASGLHGSITVKTGDGNVTSQGLDGTLDAETGDGNLNIRGRFDSLRLRTGDGNVNTEAGHGSKLGNGWTISSGDGSIVLRVPGDLAADLDVRTGDGSITLDLPVQVSGSLSRSSIRGKMNGGGGELRVQSGDGSIHIEKI